MVKRPKESIPKGGGKARAAIRTCPGRTSAPLMARCGNPQKVHIAGSGRLKTEKNAKRSGEESQKTQIAMAQLYLYDAVDIVMRKAKEAIISFAEGDEQRMMLMGLKRFTKYQNQPNVVQLKEMIADAVAERNGYTFD